MPNYQAMLDELRAEMTRLERDAFFIQDQIERVRAAIETVEVLAAESQEPLVQPPQMTSDEEQGFTDRVREVLRMNAPRHLTPVEIRDVLLKSTPDADPKITLIHAHNTLRRLDRQDEVKRSDDGRTAYKWVGQRSANAYADLINMSPEGKGSLQKALGIRRRG
jgi:hypothetical protein